MCTGWNCRILNSCFFSGGNSRWENPSVFAWPGNSLGCYSEVKNQSCTRSESDCSMMSFLGVQHYYLGFWGLKERQSLTRCCAGKQNKMLGILVTGVAPDFLGCCSFIRVARSSRFGDHWRFAVWGASTTAHNVSFDRFENHLTNPHQTFGWISGSPWVTNCRNWTMVYLKDATACHRISSAIRSVSHATWYRWYPFMPI